MEIHELQLKKEAEERAKRTCTDFLLLSPGFPSSLPLTPQEESLTYQGILDKLQADILKARDESFNIEVKAQEAEFARDEAKVSHKRLLCNKSTLFTTCTLIAVTSQE